MPCVTDCTLCPRTKSTEPARHETRRNIVNGWGKRDARFMFVLDSPSRDDDQAARIATGTGGSMLRDAIQRAGIRLEDCYFVGANRCWGPGATKRAEQNACRTYLLNEVEEVHPEAIIAMGSGALWSLLQLEGISKQRGSVFVREELGNIPVIPTFSPMSLFHQAGNLEFLVADIAKARRVTEDDEQWPEWGEYTLALTLDEVEAVRDHLVVQPELAFDTETSGLENFLAPDAHILCASFSAKEATGYVIPFVGQFSAPIWSEHDFPIMVEFVRQILESDSLKIAANGKFDVQWLWATHKIVPKNFYFDVQLAFAVIHEEKPHSLEHQRTIWTSMRRYEEFKDDPEIRELIKQHGYAGIPTEFLWPYAAADTDCTFRVYKRLVTELLKKSENIGGAFMQELHL